MVSHVNGTSNDWESRRADQALKTHAAAAAEHRFLMRLRRSMKAPMHVTPGDFVLDRLQYAIDLHEREHRRNLRSQRISTFWRCWWN